MAEVKKARLFLRRGTDTDRKTTTLCEGELGYSTDAFRVFVGDGSTEGGLVLGNTAFVSAGKNFNTDLSEASAAGLAHTGDIAIFPADDYTTGGSSSTINSGHATTVMILTGTNPATASHWVNVNNNIPFGNVSVSADDISGDMIHGGDISGDLTFSSDITALSAVTIPHIRNTAEDAATLDNNAANIWPLGITGSSELTAVSSIASFSNNSGAGGAGIQFVSTVGSPLSGMSSTGGLKTPTHGAWSDALILTGKGVPTTATTVILSIMIERYNRIPASGDMNNDKRAILYVSPDGTTSIMEASSLKVASKEHISTTTQVFCPINTSDNSIKIKINEFWGQITSSGSDDHGQWEINVVGYVV